MEHSQSIDKIFQSMNIMQKQVNRALKNSKAHNYDYADLEECWEAIRAPLTENGLCIIQTTKPHESGVIVVTTLGHISGQWISGELLLKPIKQDPQGFGSALTYARRYALAAITGLYQFDDDAQDACSLAYSPLPRKTPSAVGTVGTPVHIPATNPPITEGGKKFIADPSKKATPAQVGRIFKLCEVHGWAPTQAQDLVKNKYSHTRFLDLNQVEYEWICERIKTKTFDEAMKEATQDVHKWLEVNKPSAMFDENNPPPMTDDMIPF